MSMVPRIRNPLVAIKDTMSTIWTLVAITLLSFPVCGDAGTLGQVVRRSMVRRAEQQAAREVILKRAMERDAARAAVTPLTSLRSSRTVVRYTSSDSAKSALRRGLPAGSHTASRLPRGRLPLPATAARKYGIREPQVRMTVAIPKSHPVRFGRTLAGKSGVGEIELGRRLPASAVRKVQPLPKPRGAVSPISRGKKVVH